MKGVRKATAVVSEGTAFKLKLNELKYQWEKKPLENLVWD